MLDGSGAAGAGARNHAMNRDNLAALYRERLRSEAVFSEEPGPWNMPELADLLDATQLHDAAVICGLIERPEGVHVLLTQRQTGLKNHGGQVSFPGGRIDPGETPLAAAQREAFEEIGLPAEQIEPLGWLEPYATITNYRVLPLVARIHPPYLWRPSNVEVAAVFEAPLALFLSTEHARIEQRHFRGRLRSTYVVEHAGYRIWGATAAMLLRFGSQLR